MKHTLYIEWTGRTHASADEEAKGIAAAECELEAGRSWREAEAACMNAMCEGWDSVPDNWSLASRELATAASYMDDELREDIHDDDRANDPRWFLDEYRRRHAERFGGEFSFA